MNEPHAYAGIPPVDRMEALCFYLNRAQFPHWYDPATRSMKPFTLLDSLATIAIPGGER